VLLACNIPSEIAHENIATATLGN